MSSKIVYHFVNNKKYVPKLIFLNERKIRNISMVFNVENLPWKIQISWFLKPLCHLHISKKYFATFVFFCKNKPCAKSAGWNATTLIWFTIWLPGICVQPQKRGTCHKLLIKWILSKHSAVEWPHMWRITKVHKWVNSAPIFFR